MITQGSDLEINIVIDSIDSIFRHSTRPHIIGRVRVTENTVVLNIGPDLVVPFLHVEMPFFPIFLSIGILPAGFQEDVRIPLSPAVDGKIAGRPCAGIRSYVGAGFVIVADLFPVLVVNSKSIGIIVPVIGDRSVFRADKVIPGAIPTREETELCRNCLCLSDICIGINLCRPELGIGIRHGQAYGVISDLVFLRH